MIRIRNLLNGDIRTKWRRDFYDAGYGPFVPFGALGGDPSPVINWDFLQSQSLTSFSRTSNATLFDSTGKLTYAANNLLLNSATLSTQTVTTGLQAGVSVILSFSGTGSVAISGGYTGSLAGTGVSDRVSLKFTTTTNSLTFTVTGSVTSAQLEVVTYQTTPSTYTATTSSQYYGPRYPYAYNGSTWDAQGLLVEAAGTNLATYSNMNTGWLLTTNLSQSTSGTVKAPDNSTYCQVISSTSASVGQYFIYQKIATNVSGSTYTASAYVKYDNNQWTSIAIYDSSAWRGFNFDVQNGVAGLTSAGVNGGFTNVGGGWYRIWVSRTIANTGDVYAGVTVLGSDVDNSTNWTLAGVGQKINVAFAQAEIGFLPTSYIPNLSTGTTTRNADTSLAFSAISLPTGLSFSRASNAMQYDAAGSLTYAPQNLARYSEEINSWNTTGSPTIATNDTEGPFDATGTKTADKLTAGASGAFASYIYANYATAPIGPSIFSVYVKKVNQRYVFIDNYGGAGDFVAVFDLDTGTHVGNGGQTSPANVGISAVGTNGWYRIWLRRDNVGATLAIGTATGNNCTQTSGDAIYIWGIQLEAVTYETVARPYVANSTANAVYGPRYDYDPLTRLPKGLLIEEGRTNSTLYSEQFNNAAWTTSNLAGTPTADASISPNGTQTADKIIPANGSVSAPCVYYFATTTSETRTLSCYVKSAGYIRAFLRVGGSGTPSPIVVFLLSGSGSVEASQNSISTGISQVGNGWYRIWVTYANSNLLYVPNIGATSATYTLSSTDITATGNGTDGIFAWGAQLEAGSFPTSYIPTTSASVARSADIATLTGTALTTLQGSAGSAITETSNWCSNNAVIISDASYNLFLSNTFGNSGNTLVGGPQSKVVTLGSGSLVAIQRQAIAWSASGYSLTASGASVATGTALTTPGTVYLGSNGSATFFNGYARKFAAYDVKLADAKLQQKSVVGATF